MGGGTGAEGIDPRVVRIIVLRAQIVRLKREIRDHAPTVEDYMKTPLGILTIPHPAPLPSDRPAQANPRGQVEVGRRLGPPPPPPPESDPGIEIREGGLLRLSRPQPIEKGVIIRICCWKAWLWPWHRCKEEKQ